MQKKCMAFMAMAAGLLVGSQDSFAVPMYYTFEGAVSSFTDTIGGVAPTIGSSLSVTLMIDFDENGERTFYNGTVEEITDFTENQSWRRSSRESFYVDFISGTVMTPVNGGYNNATNSPTATEEFNMGFISKEEHYTADGANDFTRADLAVLGANDPLKLEQNYDANNPGYVVWQDPDFSIGSAWQLNQYVTSDQGPGSVAYMRGDVVITSITAPGGPDPVPEPATMLLFGTGLAGLVGTRLRKKNK